MTTSVKSSSADKSVQHVLNSIPVVAKASVAQRGIQRARAPAVQIDREDLSLDVPDLSEKTSEQDNFQADAAVEQAITNVAWAPASATPDVLLAQAAPADEACTASDAAEANSGTKCIYWGVASSTASTAAGTSSLWTGVAVMGGLLVAGLSGGSNKTESQMQTNTPLKLTVQGGLIAGAKVYVSRGVDGDRQLVGETDANGQLVLSQALTGTGVLIAVGGKNTDTGLANTLDLKISFVGGLSTSSVMTPVTTLVTALLDSGAAPNMGAAETKVKEMLGLSAQLNLSTFDPMATANAGNADALALRKAGAQIVQLATQMPDEDRFFIALATEVKRAENWRTLVQDESFVATSLAEQMPQMSLEQRATLSASMVKGMVDLGAVKSADLLSGVQVSAARLNVALYQDTGTDTSTRNDRITTNAQLDIFGYNSGQKEGIEISLDRGKTWMAYDKAQFTPNGGVQDITVKVRQAGLPGTQSDELNFTWVTQTALAPQLSLPLDTGTMGGQPITRNPQITLGQVNNQAIVVGGKTFTPKFEYSLNGADYQAVSEEGLFASLQAQTALADGRYDIRVRTYYTGLSLESTPARLSFTLDRQVTAPEGYAITAVEGGIQDPDSTDRVFSSQGATSVLFKLNQAPEAGAKVWLNMNQRSYDVAAVGGVWQALIPVAHLAEGTHRPSIRIVDAAGNVATADLPPFTMDNEAYGFVLGQNTSGDDILARPEQIASLAPESDSFMQDNVTNVNLPFFVGQAEAGALVTLSVDGNTIGSGRANATGAWRIAATAVLEDGDYTPVVTVSDLAGNMSDEFEGVSFTIATAKSEVGDVVLADADPSSDKELLALIDEVGFDTTLLSAPYDDSAAVSAAGISFELTSLDTGADKTDGITIFPLPRISGTVGGAGDLLVFVSLRGSSPDGELETVKFAPIAAVDGDEWSVQVTQPLGAEGETHTYVPYITVMDGAGNITRTTGAPIVIDRQAPEEATVDLVHDEDSDSGMDVNDGITAILQPMLQGTAEPGATVVVDVLADGSLVYVATVESDGTWTVQVVDDLPEGEWTPQITVIDVAGNVSAAIDGEMAFTVDATAPDAPEFNAFGDVEGNDTGITDDLITGNNTPTLSGVAEEGSFVTVTVGDWVSDPIEAVGGEWSVTVDEELADATYTLEVVAMDAAGNESEVVLGETFTVLTTPPDAGDLSVGLQHDDASDTGLDAEDNITNSAELQIVGTAPAGMRVLVELGGTVYGVEGEEIYADENGDWSVTITDLPEDEYTPVARLVDVVGNVSDDVEGEAFTVDLTPPEDVTANLARDADNDTGVDAEDGITNNTAPVISGTAEASALVTVTVGDWTTDEPVLVDEDGNWSVTVGLDLEEGEYNPVVTVADVAGNLLEEFEGELFTVKTTVETPEVYAFGDTEGNDTGITDDFVTANNTPTLSGFAEEGAFVTVTVGDWVSEPIEAVGGEWSVTVDELADGEYTPEVVVVDLAGNESEVVLGEAFTVLTTPTDAGDLTVGLQHDSASDTGLDAEDNITNSAELQIVGTAPAGMRVKVELEGTVYGADGEEIFADEEGNWSVTITDLPEGEYTPVARLVDVVGNESDDVEGEAFTVDLTPPEGVTANLARDADNDTGVDAEDGITNNTAPVISGTAEASALVTVTVGDWTTDEPVLVDEDGNWSVTVGLDLEEGEYNPVVTVADVAGNLLEEFEGELFTVKTTVETPEVYAFGDTEGNDTGITDDFVTANNTPTLSGFAEEGAFVTVTVGDWVSEPIEAVGGEWSVTVDELADGEYTPEVVVVDLAGNESEVVLGDKFTVDTVMSEQPTLADFSGLEGNDTGGSLTDRITNNVAPVFEGQAEALALVTLIIQKLSEDDVWQVVQEVEPVEADDSGYWTASLSEDLLDGTYRAVIKAADLAGNESQQVVGQSFTVDTVAPELPLQLAANIVYINTPMNYWPNSGSGLYVVSLEDATGNLPEGLTIDDTSYQVTGLTEVAGFTWLSATMADTAGNEAGLTVYQPLIFVSDIRPTSQTVNHTSATAAKLFQGTSGNDTGFSLFKAPGDVLLTKEGDDLVTVSNADGLGFAYVDGGAGTDTMKFTVADMALDFSQFNNPDSGQLLKNFEVFQFTGRQASVSISAADIFGLSGEVLGESHVYRLRIDGASGEQTGSVTELDPVTKINSSDDEVNETFDSTGSQSNSGRYHQYTGVYTDGLEIDRVVSLLIDKNIVI